jgi:hypothetical protein
MNIREIVTEYMEKNGFTAIKAPLNCECFLGDMCDEPSKNCQMAYKVTCIKCGEHFASLNNFNERCSECDESND